MRENSNCHNSEVHSAICYISCALAKYLATTYIFPPEINRHVECIEITKASEIGEDRSFLFLAGLKGDPVN